MVPSFWGGSLVTLLFLFACCQERPLCLLLLSVSNSDHPRLPGPALPRSLSLYPLRLPRCQCQPLSTASPPCGIFPLCHSKAPVLSWLCTPSQTLCPSHRLPGPGELSPVRFTASPAPMLLEPVPHPAGFPVPAPSFPPLTPRNC